MLLLLLTVLVSTAVGTNSYSMTTDCSGIKYEPTLYEQICCQDNNLGKSTSVKEKNRNLVILCPSTRPVSCPGIVHLLYVMSNEVTYSFNKKL